MPTDTDLIREARDYIGELVRPRVGESAINMWARGVELEAKLRKALRCPWGKGMPDPGIEPETPCPVCGDLGTLKLTSGLSKCIE